MRFFGKIGYGESQASMDSPDVWDDVITEVDRGGDVIRAGTNLDPSENVVNDLKVNNAISVVADATLTAHFRNIRFVEWDGVCWKVTAVQVSPPRLILNIGEVYSGPRASS